MTRLILHLARTRLTSFSQCGALALTAACSTAAAPPTTSFSLDEAFGTRQIVDLDLIEASFDDVGSAALIASAPAARLWAWVRSTAEPSGDPRAELNAGALGLLEALGPIAVAVGRPSGDEQDPVAWFLERKTARLSRFDSAFTDREVSRDGRVTYFFDGEVSGLVNDDENGRHRVFLTPGKYKAACRTLHDHLQPMPGDSLDSLAFLQEQRPHDNVKGTRVGELHRMEFEYRKEPGSDDTVRHQVWFQRHGSGWLPILWRRAFPGHMEEACAVWYRQDPRAGWVPARSLQVFWESYLDLHDAVVTAAEWRSWRSCTSGSDIAFPDHLARRR